MIRRTSALVLAALAVVLLAGCGSGETAPPSAPRTIQVTPAPTGTKVEARVGDTVVVSVEANPTTGYEWTFTAGDTFRIVTSEYVASPNPDGLVGSGGAQVVTLEVTEAGASDLTGTYARSWETPSPGAGPDLTMTIASE